MHYIRYKIAILFLSGLLLLTACVPSETTLPSSSQTSREISSTSQSGNLSASSYESSATQSVSIPESSNDTSEAEVPVVEIPTITEKNQIVTIEGLTHNTGPHGGFKFSIENDHNKVKILNNDLTVLWADGENSDLHQIEIIRNGQTKYYSFLDAIHDFYPGILNNYCRKIYQTDQYIYFFFTGITMKDKYGTYCFRLDVETLEFIQSEGVFTSELDYVGKYNNYFCLYLRSPHTYEAFFEVLDMDDLTLVNSYNMDDFEMSSENEPLIVLNEEKLTLEQFMQQNGY